jgi:hypothetical protein
MTKIGDKIYVDVNYKNKVVIKHLLSDGIVNKVHLEKDEAFKFMIYLFIHFVNLESK